MHAGLSYKEPATARRPPTTIPVDWLLPASFLLHCRLAMGLVFHCDLGPAAAHPDGTALSWDGGRH